MNKTKFLLIILAVVFMLSACESPDYDRANNNTRAMTDYTVAISTIITIEDAKGTRQSAIDQMVNVNSKGKYSMIYNVKTTATSTDTLSGEVVSEENSYMFYDNSYYYTYPGVRYKSATEYDMALANIENLTDVITFSENEMVNVEWERLDGEDVVSYQVDYADTSPFVKGVLENAAATFEGIEFSPTDMSASSTVVNNAVTARELYVSYEAMTGESIAVEIYVDYKAAETLEKPDESKFVNIAG